MGTPLQVGALVARTLSLLHNIPLIGVNHCVGRKFPLFLLSRVGLAYGQISRWADRSHHLTIPSSYTSPVAIHKSSHIRSSDTAYLGRLWILPLATAWIGLRE